MFRYFICTIAALVLLDLKDKVLDLGHKKDEEEPTMAAVTIFPEYADRRFPSGVPVEVCHCSVCHPQCAPYIDGCPQV